MRGNSLDTRAQQSHRQRVSVQAQEEIDRVLAMVALRICRTLNVEEILQTATHEIRQSLQTDRAVIYRFEANGSGSMVAEAVGAPWPSLLQQTTEDPRLADYWQQVCANGQVQVIANVGAQDQNEYRLNLLAKAQIKANLAIPIVRSQNVCLNPSQGSETSTLWGFIATQQCGEPREWTVSEIDFLQQLAIYIELAIQR
ncbi:MAG: GAF domain-containing protein, partial [Thermosynechococcaceae cyanobacterium]